MTIRTWPEYIIHMGIDANMNLPWHFLNVLALLSVVSALSATNPSVHANKPESIIEPIAARDPSRNTTLDIRSLSISTFFKDCGLRKPTAEAWTANHAAIVDFVENNRESFLESGEDSFSIYLRDRYASYASPSTLNCDSVSECSITSCRNLDTDISIEEQQVAYLVFEQLSGIAHVMRGAQSATDIAGAYFLNAASDLVRRYSGAQHLEDVAKSRLDKKKFIFSAVTAFVLLAAAATAIPTIGSTSLAASSISVMANIMAAHYIGQSGMINTKLDAEGIPDWTGMLEDKFTLKMNDVLHGQATETNNNFRNLLQGKRNHNNQTIFDLLTDREFASPDTDIIPSLQQNQERWYFASAVNSLWAFDRPYILDTDALTGCENDLRGPPDYRVCLSEFPNRSFWLYAMTRMEENDFAWDDQAQINGPTGFHDFDREKNETHSITREDIVRSSLFVHRNNLGDAVYDLDVPKIRVAFKKEVSEGLKDFGKVPGAFTIPVCRNVGGESISSVWSDKSRNYPCMCGDGFTWNRGWTQDKDETERFLELTGFMFSEDWEDYCSDHNKCKGQNDINWYTSFTAKRYKGDPEIPYKLKHPFYTCRRPQGHENYGRPE
jgi:hypothetical protein